MSFARKIANKWKHTVNMGAAAKAEAMAAALSAEVFDRPP
jgi:hypothetical protein